MARSVLSEYLSLDLAAERLGVSIEQMLAWRMVVVTKEQGQPRVPEWSADPAIARYLPALSRVFADDALTFCLTRPDLMGDGRDGLTALRQGDWQAVLARLRALRARLSDTLESLDHRAASGWLH